MPNFPTDNLYKFITILGLFLIGFASYRFFVSMEATRIEGHDIKIAKALIEGEHDDMIKELDETGNALKKRAEVMKLTKDENYYIRNVYALRIMSRFYNKKMANAEFLDESDILTAGTIDQLIYHLEKIADSKKELNKIETKEKMIVEKYRNEIGNFVFFSICGLFWFFAGVWMWYNKKQKFDDILVAQEMLSRNVVKKKRTGFSRVRRIYS